MDFPKIKYTNAKHFNLVYVHEPKFGVLDFIFGIARFEVFLAQFSFRLSRPFYFSYFLLLIFFLAAKSRAKPGNGTLINYRYNGPF